jgi:hypothetical protein
LLATAILTNVGPVLRTAGNGGDNNSPSLRLDKPGCCARLLIGALFAGVFCGVLRS